MSSREHSFAWIQVKCEERDKAIITSEGHIIYFSSKGVLKKYQFDKFNGGNAGSIEPDVRLLENARFQMLIDKPSDDKPEKPNLENLINTFDDDRNNQTNFIPENEIVEVNSQDEYD